jgi:hypothetical protein
MLRVTCESYMLCRYAECRYTECLDAECHYAECHGAVNRMLDSSTYPG